MKALSRWSSLLRRSRRTLSSSSSEVRPWVQRVREMDVREIEWERPAGTLRGIEMGNPSGIPILCVHGWLDNSNSFKPLATYMDLDKYRLVSFDLPGHGRSDHIARGLNYSITDGLLVLKKLHDYLALEKSVVMGHSLGAGMCSWYAAAFPEKIDKLIMIDLISFGPAPIRKHARATRKGVEMSLDIHEKLEKSSKDDVPKYDFDEAVARAFMANQLLHGSDSISRESVELLMERGLTKLPDGLYTWSSDLRLRIPSAVNLVLEQAEHYASQIDSPHLLIKATDSPLYMSEEVADSIIRTYHANNPDFQFHYVEGGHHVHMNSPELVAPIINKFLDSPFKNKGTEEKENMPFSL